MNFLYKLLHVREHFNAWCFFKAAVHIHGIHAWQLQAGKFRCVFGTNASAEEEWMLVWIRI